MNAHRISDWIDATPAEAVSVADAQDAARAERVAFYRQLQAANPRYAAAYRSGGRRALYSAIGADIDAAEAEGLS